MADIELVIKIPEELYSLIKDGYACEEDADEVINLIPKAFVLPKGHGDLIDRKALLDNGYQMEPVEMWYGIKHADTIIEADKSYERSNDDPECELER